MHQATPAETHTTHTTFGSTSKLGASDIQSLSVNSLGSKK